MAGGCGKKLTKYVERGFRYIEIKVRCGNTSPSGYPYLCAGCEEEHSGVNWRQEAMEHGEAWGEEDY